jgi:beta-lactamase class A
VFRQPNNNSFLNSTRFFPPDRQHEKFSHFHQSSNGVVETTQSSQYQRRQRNTIRPTTLAVTAKPIKTAQPSRIQRRRRSPGPMTSVLLYILRLVILGVGIGAIAGTALTAFDPTGSIARTNPIETLKSSKSPKSQPKPQLQALAAPLSLDGEITSLKKKLEVLAAQNPELKLGAFFVDLDNGDYVDLHGENTFSAASTIKIPILIAFFQAVDAGKIYLDEMLTMDKAQIAEGSGTMQYQKPGTKFSALEVVTKMIIISDNTATNMIIARLGGKEAVNQKFKIWGLTITTINNALPDLKGTNTTTPKELGQLLMRVNQGELITLRSRDRMLGIMEKTHTRTLLPQGLEKNAIIAHKTGDIGSTLGDAGIVDMPSGKRYIGAVMVKRPHNDPKARELIQAVSKTTYQHLKWYQPHPSSH